VWTPISAMSEPASPPAPPPATVVVAGRLHPHEVLFCVVALLTGVIYLLGAEAPNSVSALLPGWTVRLWAFGLAAHGLFALLGIVMRWLVVEQVAMLAGALVLVWYAAGVGQLAATVGWRAALSAGILVAWSAANVWRAWQIYRMLRPQ
jgi:hypothetical protein